MMLETMLRRALPRVAVLLLASWLAGCATDALQRDGSRLIDEGRYEEGLAKLDQAVREQPRDAAVNMAQTTQRARVIAALLATAERSRLMRDHNAAVRGFERVLAIDPANERAREALRQLDKLRNTGETVRQAQTALRRGDPDGADRLVRQVLAIDPRNEGALALKREIEDIRANNVTPYPQLRSKMSAPVTLEFRDGNLKQIFEVLSRNAGINFLFDKDVKSDLKATLFVRQVPVEQAVELLLLQNQLQLKIISDNTVMIYPDTPQKQRDYLDLTIRTFHLANIDAKTAMNMIKTLLKSKDVFIDERLNTLTMRDTPDAIRLADKLLTTQGLPEPEVVLEVEVMEVSRQRILDLGLQWPSTFGILRPDLGGVPGVLSDYRGINGDRITIGPSPELRINANDSDVNTLANPVIRVSNKEKARIHIGQRVPVVSATSTPSTQGPVITESIQYLEVGLKLEVEPTVHLNDEVLIKIGLEVSKATAQTPTKNGTIPVQVDTRNATTSLRLKDGETQILAGLMRNDHDVSGNRIPGLGDLPGLGRLFGSNKDTIGKSELVLSITPRIVRNMPYMNPYDIEYPSGTEAVLKARSDTMLRMTTTAPVVPNAATRDAIAPAAAAAPQVQAAAAAPAPAAVLALAPPAAAGSDVPAVAASPAAATLSWTAPAALKPGEETDVILRASVTQPLTATTLQFAYDPAALRVVAVTEGDVMNADGSITSFAPRIDDKAGRMFVALSRSAPQGARGDGALMRLRVVALPGSSAAAELKVTSVTAFGEGNRPVSVPLPAALALGAKP
ncbi:secretin and TonB N-terminal domain-containing protein [Aromatoleum toluclasticum]|uniref:secretin and TonB N-terminal domain-containing protein n=1 Tax=Aromatoleum toluclasticum TaxID=92003 RepID=UPI001D18E4AF|nr:secretin and TonB N-terminal domain-containing protein [Aromatoleum toluclasticum]MCC4114354.1 secretin and TonB N-terminal domain-containing protein [Aromatoleum toluclasticum]